MFRRRPKENLQPQWLFVGLGNPGGEYDGTRHNVGFETIRTLSERHRLKLDTRKFQSHYGVGRIQDNVVAICKPMTYMNSSGSACATLLKHFGLQPAQLVVIYDDMDLESGRVQVKPHGGGGSHNGMKSIISSLGTKEFPRIRIGIGAPPAIGVDYVLSRFTPEELDVILPAIQRSADACEIIAEEGINIAMNRINLPKNKDASEEAE